MSRRLRVNAADCTAFRHRSLRAISRGVWLIALLASACTEGGNSNFPLFRSLGWFSHLNGSDIRDACVAGSGARYRFVYNAVWTQQARDYEVIAPPGQAGGQLATRIIFPENLTSIDLTDPLALYSGKRSIAAVTSADLGALVALLRQSAFYDPAPSGLVLPSDGYYWTVASCENGTFHFNAYVYPSDRFAAIRFDAWLFTRDGTGVPIRTAQPVPPRQSYNRSVAEDRGYSIFDLEVGTNGLVLVR
jgi:hypothetical protein